MNPPPYPPVLLPQALAQRAPPPTAPQSTLYIRNLCQAMPIEKLHTIINALFSEYGIVDIRIKRNIAHRGQAFVSFKDTETAIHVKESCDGFPLFGRPMRIQFAREPAFKVSELNGTIEEHKQQRKKTLALEPEDLLPPNHILFIQNLPDTTTEESLVELFQPFHGFKEVRLVPGRSNIAFVEYDNEIQSTVARHALNGYQISPENDMKVSYAKKS